jgi:wobble nucleotide-excising tRNase
MIKKLTIHKVATYTDKVEIEPTEVNYLFGSNGTGKSTFTKVIANPHNYNDSIIEWKTTPIETLVYNKDFVKDNFGESSSIKGIFTLGKGATDAKKFIEVTKPKVDTLKAAIEGLKNSHAIKVQEENTNINLATENCWKRKVLHDTTFRPAFTGYLKKDLFFSKCLSEQANTSALLTLEDLNAKCAKIYSSDLKEYIIVPKFNYDELQSIEETEILNTKIIGKEDVAIGALIKKLNNSDWIKEGVEFLNESDDKCPFCQQDLAEQLKADIESFFDETYLNKCKELANFKATYSNYVTSKIQELKSTSSKSIEIINFEELIIQTELIESKYKSNLAIIDKKIKAPSTSVTIETLTVLFERASNIINSYRIAIASNNKMVANIGQEKTKLASEIWKFIGTDTAADITTYKNTDDAIQKAKKSIVDAGKIKKTEKDELEKQIKENETKITSITHTINEIGKILKLFGFTNFSIAEAEEKGYYKIVREDGSDCKETLSEGEYTFITFLYFYQLLKGSQEESGLTNDKIVVIDDPISSLDSNILFVVSNLIKEIVSDCLTKKNGIKQLFILTHNIYFHKEVTFKGSRETASNKESFWIVRRLNNITKIVKHSHNPIQTTYELLWRELDNLEEINKATIHNTLRRILEYYFKIIGGIDYEKCINSFEGEEKIICKTLVSWINDGSHFINDDLVVYVEPESIEKYLIVFKSVFEKMGHESHYKMMSKQ